MKKITIENKQYDYDSLSDISKSQLKKIRYVQKKLNVLYAEVNILKAAESTYYSILKKEVESSD